MDGQSIDIRQNDTALLREFFPHVFSEGKLDLEKLKTAFCDDIDANLAGERYTLGWAGKADAFRALQERTAATLKPQPELSVNFDIAENVFIEGENLEVLKVLQKSYYNSVKCVIIDPPYNTGNDSFIYPDRFKENLEEYEKRAGERDEDGYLMKEGLFRKNSRENGHYHSNWLSMMLPRLFLARGVMRDDGVIFVHIDDNEAHNLRMVMNEIFGEENFVCQFVWESKYTVSNDAKWVSGQHEYVLCYAKSMNNFNIGRLDRTIEQDKSYKNLDNDENGPWKATPLHAKSGTEKSKYEVTFDNGITWSCPQGRYPRYNKERLLALYEEGALYFNKNGGVDRKTYLSEVSEKGVVVGSMLNYEKVGHTHGNNEELAVLMGKGMFDNPKGTKLAKHLMQIANINNDENANILDFFAGSGTIAHAVLELNKEDGGNRKFILVQLPELCDESSEAHKAGYKTIADISRERIRRVIKKIGEGGFKSYKLSPSNFKVWRGEEVTDENLLSQAEVSVDRAKPECLAEAMLVELMLKSGYKLTDKVENRGDFYYIGGELVIALTKIDSEVSTKILELEPKPQKVIVLDRLFAGNDELKTNTALQLRDAGVGFRVV
jgi:adenine-specific DNA-methyltransferase